MSNKHHGKLTIAPDCDWITGDSVGFELVANLPQLSSWVEWMKIMKHWCKNNSLSSLSLSFFFSLSKQPAFLPSSSYLPSVHLSIQPSLLLSLPPGFSNCTISWTDWLLLVKIDLNLIQMIVTGANFCCKKVERPFSLCHKAVTEREMESYVG